MRKYVYDVSDFLSHRKLRDLVAAVILLIFDFKAVIGGSLVQACLLFYCLRVGLITSEVVGKGAVDILFVISRLVTKFLIKRFLIK